MNGHLYILGTIFFTVYGQIILKWRLSCISFALKEDSILNNIITLIKVIFDPFVFSGFCSAFIASLFWMGAISKFEITYAYLFMSLSPALVFLLGTLFLGETFTLGKLIGLIIIIAGVFITVKY